jgi:hypothetical protein
MPDALEIIRSYASAGRIIIAPHAYDRMRGIGRNPRVRIHFRDIRSALTNARVCRAQEASRWLVTGPDSDGDDLDLVVVIDDGVIVVTVL